MCGEVETCWENPARASLPTLDENTPPKVEPVFTMMTNNPYQPPQEAAPRDRAGPRLLLWSIVAVFGCALLGGAIGLGIGAALGYFVPAYYRSVFADGNAPHFDPLAVGIGQGLTQGVALGGVVGVALVAVFYWRFGRWTPKPNR